MLETLKKFFANALNFKDRTSRGDFWITILAILILSFIVDFFPIGIISAFVSETLADLLEIVFLLFIFISSLALEVRRLHDVNKSGWYLLLQFIPVVGTILLLIAYCSKTVEPNEYGRQV